MKENEYMICVPYGDFMDGVHAIADLDSIRAMITDSGEYCSNAIKAVLGLVIESGSPFGEGEKK